VSSSPSLADLASGGWSDRGLRALIYRSAASPNPIHPPSDAIAYIHLPPCVVKHEQVLRLLRLRALLLPLTLWCRDSFAWSLHRLTVRKACGRRIESCVFEGPRLVLRCDCIRFVGIPDTFASACVCCRPITADARWSDQGLRARWSAAASMRSSILSSQAPCV